MFDGKLVNLRTVSMDDLEHFYELWSNQNIMQYMAFDAITTKAEAREMMLAMLHGINDQMELRMKIVDHEGIFLGCVGVPHLDLIRQMCEISFELLEEYHHKGYAYESVSMFIAYLFEHYQLDYIEAIIFPFNEASAKLLQKLAFEYQGRVRKYLKKNGRWYDVDVYHLSKKKWTSFLYEGVTI